MVIGYRLWVIEAGDCTKRFIISFLSFKAAKVQNYLSENRINVLEKNVFLPRH
jgi:hypothetical protein